MPPRAKKIEESPTPAETAAAEATPEQQDDTILVPFRGTDIPVPNPAKAARSFALQMAFASGNDARILYELIGDRGTRMIQSLIGPADDFVAVVREFFEAYGQVTGQGNS